MEEPSSGEAELRAWTRRREVVADLGRRALETDDLDRLLREASTAVAETVESEHCCVLEAAIDRRGRERTLRETRAQLEVATEAASVGLWTWEIRNDVVTADGFVAESYGIDPATAAAGAPIDVFYDAIHEEDRERTIDRVEQALEETVELRAEYRVRNADGTVMWLVARGAVEYDDGTPVRMTGAISDITE